MISIYKIKPAFQKILIPVLIYLHKRGISANAITWTSILLSLATGLIFYLRPFGITFLFVALALLFRMALNALDGMMARNYNMVSKKGEQLNELGDVISDLFIFFPFLFIEPLSTVLVVIFLLLSVLNEFAGVLSKAIGGSRRYDGPMGKSDRALAVGLICILLYFWPAFYVYLNSVFIVMIFLLILSTGIRIRRTFKKTSE